MWLNVHILWILFCSSFFKHSEEKRRMSPSRGQGCFILTRQSKKGGSSGAQQLFTAYFYEQPVTTERKYSLFNSLSKTLQRSRLFVAINENIVALRRSRLKVKPQRMKQPCPAAGNSLANGINKTYLRSVNLRLWRFSCWLIRTTYTPADNSFTLKFCCLEALMEATTIAQPSGIPTSLWYFEDKPARHITRIYEGVLPSLCISRKMAVLTSLYKITLLPLSAALSEAYCTTFMIDPPDNS